MFIGRSRIFLPAEEAHQPLADRVVRVARLNYLPRREGAHRVANLNLRPVIARVCNPSAHRGICRKIMIADEKLALCDLWYLAVTNGEMSRLRNTIRTGREPNLPVDLLRQASLPCKLFSYRPAGVDRLRRVAR